MNLNRALVRLYPTSWRARYGEEFTALLEERPVGPFDVADIVLGAMDARLRLRNLHAAREPGGISMSLRIGGMAAIAGAALLALAALVSMGLAETSEAVPGILFVTGLALLLVALAGMSAFQARAHPRLAWVAFAVPAVGTLVSVLGLVGMSIVGEWAWTVWFFGTLTALVGSALFAVVTYRTAALSRGAALLLGVGSVLPFAGLVVPDSTIVLPPAIACFLVGWFLLGVHAIRLDRPATVARPV